MSGRGRLDGKIAIVTASTEGIGLAIAERLAKDGAKVMISSRKSANVERAVDSLKKKGLAVSGIVCHVAKPEHRKQLIEKTLSEFGGIDILVSNAAVNPHYGHILDIKEDAWDKIFEVNVKSAFFLTKEVVPHIEARGGGSILFVSSQGGYVAGEMLGAYSISKTAMLGMVKALVPQLARSKIRVNGIAPGLVKTRFSETLGRHPGVLEAYNELIPLKRCAEPEECAGIVSFLVSDDASYITGENVTITGGVPNRL